MSDIKRIKASELTPDPHNANKGTERGRYALEASLRQYGAGRSILVDREGRIIAGNKTLETAADVGLDDVIVVQTDGTQIVAVQRMDLDLANDEQARMLAYADNRVAELDLDFDAEVLAADLAAGLPLDELWQDFELDEIMAELEPEPTPGEDTEPQVDRAAELAKEWGVETGQLWQLGDHRLICGDCTDAAVVERVMGGEKAQITFTSPPYNLGDTVSISNRSESRKGAGSAYDGYSDDLPLSDYFHLLESFTVLALKWCDYVVVNIQQLASNKLALVDYLARFKRNYVDVAVWCKTNQQPAMAENVMNSSFEFVFVFSGDDCPTRAISTGSFRGTVSNVYTSTINTNEWADVHGAAFPIDFAERFIGSFSAYGGGVFEPFGGLGTTIIACENLNRQCRAVEISPGYVAVALQRWADHTGRTPELIAQD